MTLQSNHDNSHTRRTSDQNEHQDLVNRTIPKKHPIDVTASLQEYEQTEDIPGTSRMTLQGNHGNSYTRTGMQGNLLPSQSFLHTGHPAPPQTIPIEVSGGEHHNPNYGPVNKYNRTAGFGDGDFRNSIIGANEVTVHYNQMNDSDRGIEATQACTDHNGCCKLTGSICFFPHQRLSKAKNSRVYAGVQKSFIGDTLLAVKLCTMYSSETCKEAENLSKLCPHQNVVAFIHSGLCLWCPEKTLFIATERCSTVNLGRYIEICKEKNIPFNIGQAFEHSKQLIEVIQHMHRNEILHINLKPANVLLSRCGRYLKIYDLESSEVLQNGSVMATKIVIDEYTAPEMSSKKLLTKKVDVFPLGLLIHQILSYGCHAFGPNAEDWVKNIISGTNCDLSHLRVPFLWGMARVLEKMLKLRPVERPDIEEIYNQFVKPDWLSLLMENLVQIWLGTIKGCQKNVTDEEPTGYIVASSKDEVKRLLNKLIKMDQMALITLSECGTNMKGLVLISDREYPKLHGFFLHSQEIVHHILAQAGVSFPLEDCALEER